VTDPAVTDPATPAAPPATDPVAPTDPATTPADPATTPPTQQAEPTTPTATPIAPATTPTEEEPEEEPEEVTPEEETETEETEPTEPEETETEETETEETETEETETAAAPAEEGEVTITLDNVGDDAWVLTSAEGETVAEEGQENPTLTLSVGTRYRIVNEGGAEHPLDFRAEDNTFLLAQGNIEGEFEDDQEVNWQDDVGEVSFTLTQELADQLAVYYCTVHPDMRGDIEIAGAN
jgi:hypothetical protein